MRTFSHLLAFVLAGVLAIPVIAEDPPAPPVRVKAKGVRVGVAAQPATPAGAQLSDDEALKKAGLTPDDGPKLLEYLRQRTLSDIDVNRITEVIKRFGADDFDDRVKATEEAESFGPAAVGPLKAAERNPDPEIAYRARLTLKKMEKVPHSAVASAAVRAVVKLKPDGAAAALIGFLPLADNETVSEAIRTALVALATKDGKAEPALITALNDKSALRRSAAYHAIIEGGPKDALAKVREAVLKDPDTDCKFSGLWSLTLTTRDKEHLPELISLIPQLNRGRIWQLEELLLQLAGSHPKDGRFLKSPESLTKARDAWLGWWKEKGEKLDLAKIDFKPRLKGFTDIVEMDPRFGTGRVVSLGPDLKEKWRLTNVNSPVDVKVTDDGRVWVAEMNINQVTERTTDGTVLNRRGVTQPMTIDLLPGGGMVVFGRGQIVEFDKDGKLLNNYPRNNYDISSGRRLPNGESVVVTGIYQQPNGPKQVNCFRLDAKLKDAAKNLTLNQMQNSQVMDVIGEDKILVCELENTPTGLQNSRVAEYSLKDGKQTWKYECPQNSAPSSCQRLPNGNTLIALMNQNRAIEVDPSGEIVWEYQAQDGFRVGRVWRR